MSGEVTQGARPAELIIDLFNPVVPAGLGDQWRRAASRPLQVDVLRSAPELNDLQGYFAKMDELGDYRQVVAIPPSVASALTAVKGGGKAIEACNEALAALCRKHPERFPGFCAVLPINSARDMADEALRSIQDLGACAVQLDLHMLGRDSSPIQCDDLFDILVRADLPLYLPDEHRLQAKAGTAERKDSQHWQEMPGPATAQGRGFNEGAMRHPGLRICVNYGAHFVHMGTVHTGTDEPTAKAGTLRTEALGFSTTRCLQSSEGLAQIAGAVQSVRTLPLSTHERRRVLSDAAARLLQLEESLL